MQQVIFLMGPTASGKTALAIELTKRLPCDIISVDSAMIYRGMDIGTAKPSHEELASAPHRLIDIKDPIESYSAADFCVDAKREIDSILANGRIPLLVGGTMMYFHALQNGLSELPSADETIRKKIYQEADQLGWPSLHQRLAAVDPVSASKMSPQDSQRISRALEVYEITGQALSSLWNKRVDPLPYSIVPLAIMPADRAALHQRIAQRFHAMMQQGFLAEAEHLYRRGDLHTSLPSIRCVNYRQAWDYLAGNVSLAEFEQKAIVATRQLAKRQITWLRSWPKVVAMDGKLSDLLAHAMSTLG